MQMQNDECRMECGRRYRTAIRLSFCILHSAFCIAATGCNVVGAIASRVGPPPAIPAEYLLPLVPTAVVVENFHNPASLRLESDAIARRIADELSMQGFAPLIEPGEIENLRRRD